jgi:hypothetical protein
MWVLENWTPYAVERNWFLDKNAAKSWIVAIKATYDITANGTTSLAKKQQEPFYCETYSGEAGRSSILYESDLSGPKAATDVLLNGKAYAPGGKPAQRVTVRLTVDRMTKTLQVSGDRYWLKEMVGGFTMTSPEPFEEMPIIYERAFGGRDTRHADSADHQFEPLNPIGTGFATREKHLEGQAAPNIEDPNQLISSWKDRPPPAGFGAISSYWLPRRRYAGTYDARWQRERFPLWAEDFDDRFFQCAPPDQQVPGFLRGGETVELENLSPTGYLSFVLPKVYPVFTTRFGKESVEHRGHIQTVILEPDYPRVILVWHTALPCQHRADYLDATVIREKRYI